MSSRRRFDARQPRQTLQLFTRPDAGSSSLSTPEAHTVSCSHNFSQMPIHSVQQARPQTHLAVSQPGDVYEQEAEQVAEHIMSSPDPEPAVSEAPAGTKNVQRSGSGNPGDQTMFSGEGVQSLDAVTRAFMEPRFGHDFSKIRIHTDRHAAASAQSLQAQAYTVGQDVYFGAGYYVPETDRGKRLIAHELTHMIQQGVAGVLNQSKPSRATLSVPGTLIQRQPGDETSSNDPDQQYNDALQQARQTGNYQDAVEKLNGFNREDIQDRLGQLTADEIAYLHLGALDNPRLGPQSQIALLTAPATPMPSDQASQDQANQGQGGAPNSDRSTNQGQEGAVATDQTQGNGSGGTDQPGGANASSIAHQPDDASSTNVSQHPDADKINKTLAKQAPNVFTVDKFGALIGGSNKIALPGNPDAVKIYEILSQQMPDIFHPREYSVDLSKIPLSVGGFGSGGGAITGAFIIFGVEGHLGPLEGEVVGIGGWNSDHGGYVGVIPEIGGEGEGLSGTVGAEIIYDFTAKQGKHWNVEGAGFFNAGLGPVGVGIAMPFKSDEKSFYIYGSVGHIVFGAGIDVDPNK